MHMHIFYSSEASTKGQSSCAVGNKRGLPNDNRQSTAPVKVARSGKISFQIEEFALSMILL